MKQIPLGTRFYENRSLPSSRQTLINMFLETQAPDSKSPVVVRRTPGLKDYLTVGSGPIRGILEMGGILYVVSGTELYSVSNLVATLIGTISGSGSVGVAINDREAGQQLVITNGTTTQYVYTVSGGLTTATLTGPAKGVVYQDGYFIYDWYNTGKWFISSVLDGTSFDSLETGATNSRPDNVIRIISNHEQLWVFGERSYEIFYNSALGDFPFSRISEATNDEIGLGARWSLVELDNTIYWVGHDGEVYRANGYNAAQISDPNVSEQLRGETLSDITAFGYTDGGHKFYQINLSDKSLVFDSKENVWHVRGYFDNGSYGKSRAVTYVYFENNHIVGDHTTGQLYTLDSTYYYDANSNPLRWQITTPPLHEMGSYFTIPNLYMDFEPGVGLVGGADPMVSLRYSNDAKTWRTLNPISIGEQGNYTNRAIARRLGGSKHQRIFEMSGSDPVSITITGLGYGA